MATARGHGETTEWTPQILRDGGDKTGTAATKPPPPPGPDPPGDPRPSLPEIPGITPKTTPRHPPLSPVSAWGCGSSCSVAGTVSVASPGISTGMDKPIGPGSPGLRDSPGATTGNSSFPTPLGHRAPPTTGKIYQDNSAARHRQSPIPVPVPVRGLGRLLPPTAGARGRPLCPARRAHDSIDGLNRIPPAIRSSR